MHKKTAIQDPILRFLATGLAASVVLVFSVFASDASESLQEAITGSMEEHEINFHSSKLSVGGWSDFVYQNRNTDGYRQIFDPHHLYLYFDARLDDRWRSYAELEFEHLPGLEGSAADESSGKGEIKMERLYLEYDDSDKVSMRVGKFNTPLGIWTPAHRAVIVPSVQKPIHEDNKYVPVKQVGLEGFGTWVLPSSELLNYSVWLSTGDDLLGTNQPTDNKFAYGADIDATFRERVKIGLTAYLQHNPGESGRREKTLFPYVEVYLPQEISLTGEYLHQSRDTGFSDIDTWYAAAKWQALPDTYLYVRLDRGDDEKRGDGLTHTAQVITLGY